MMNHKPTFFFLMIVFCCNDLVASTYSHHVSGAWYPSRGKNLERTLSELQKEARTKFPSFFDAQKIKALIVPHAGYSYSGVVACSAYQNLKLDFFDRVIILAPSHHLNFACVGLPGLQYGWFKSPLGHIALDVKMIKQLKKSSPLFVCHHQTHELEHSIEVQIPLIQKYCGDVKIVPLLVGSMNLKQMQDVADCIGKLLDEKTLLVISSDFTHYGKSFGYTPFTTDIAQNISKLDSTLVQKIQNGDAQGFVNLLEQTGDHVCGKDAITVLLLMIQKKYVGEVESYVVGYGNSAFDQKNPDHCVSYVGMVVSTQNKDQVQVYDGLKGSV